MFVMVVAALNVKETLLFTSILEALHSEGDIAYRDTLLHTIVNDIAMHIDTITSSSNLVYIIDHFFMVSIIVSFAESCPILCVSLVAFVVVLAQDKQRRYGSSFTQAILAHSEEDLFIING